jgi:hypothetical protein
MAPILSSIALSLAVVLLAAGCRTTSMDTALQNMSAQEKAFLEKLTTITKGMTPDQVIQILGPPSASFGKSQLIYYLNLREEVSSSSYTTSAMVSTGPNGTKVMPGVTVPLETKTTQADAGARVYFSNGQVVRIRFASVGMTGFYLHVLK